MDKNLNNHIPKENIKMANKHKNVFDFISYLGIAIKLTMRDHYTPIRRTKMKKIENTNC